MIDKIIIYFLLIFDHVFNWVEQLKFNNIILVSVILSILHKRKLRVDIDSISSGLETPQETVHPTLLRIGQVTQKLLSVERCYHN